MTTLYHLLIRAERVNKNIQSQYQQLKKSLKQYENLPGYQVPVYEISFVDIKEYQREILRQKEHNPILSDAIHHRKTIEDTLLELGAVNEGIRKILPRKKDKTQNERVEHIGELVQPVHQLYTHGLFYPDNLLTGALEIAALSFATLSWLIPVLYAAQSNLSQPTLSPWLVPTAASAVMGPMLGLILNFSRFENKLPIAQAQYLDGKVREFYK
jgi:hypothetical protein